MIYLASKSPRRKELLTQIGIDFEIIDIKIDETIRPRESAAQLACRLASEKAIAGWNHHLRRKDIPVLAADTLGEMGNQILQKPANKEEAVDMLNRMSGQTHIVHTAICFCYHNQCFGDITSSKVQFANLSPSDIATYCDTPEPLDKAGSYAIQGVGGKFVKTIQGSYSGIVGLPLSETLELLQQVTKSYPSLKK